MGPGGCVIIQTEEEKRLVLVRESTDFQVSEEPPKIVHVPIFPRDPVITPTYTEASTNTECDQTCCGTQTSSPEPTQENPEQTTPSTPSEPPKENKCPCGSSEQPSTSKKQQNSLTKSQGNEANIHLV